MEKIKSSFILLAFIFLSSCYKQLEMEGFEKEQWQQALKECNTYRVDVANTIIKNQDVLLEATQNEVESLLGQPEEHELYNRNQKFFHYRLTPQSDCGPHETVQFLSVRFNAIGRANLVQVMLREPKT
ncbi:MAG: hypothetical protein AAFY41_05570 [Bacteroidota bacterium]